MPKKRFGQHFISDPRILERIVQFARFEADDTVVEIGPGRGTLTAALASRAKRVIAIEIDRDLISHLRDQSTSNVRIREDDALRVDFNTVSPVPYHVVANLPYNIATALVGKFLSARSSILAATIMLQEEVANRILAAPGSRQYGALSVMVQYYAEVEAGFSLPPGAFTPQPKVDSRMVRLTWHPEVADSPGLMTLVLQAFASRRKKLVNNLAMASPTLKRDQWVALLEEQSIDPDARAENLSVDEFVRLHRALPFLGSEPYVPN